MRYPAEWETFTNNVSLLLKQLPDAKINFHFVAQVLNVQQLVPTLDWCNRQLRSTRVTNLVQPRYLGWSVFRDPEKQKIVESLQHQSQHYKITQTQKEFVKTLSNTILESVHDPAARLEFESVVGNIYKHRWPALRESNSHHMVRSHVFYPLN